MHRTLAEIVIDPEDRLLVEHAQQDRVEFAGRFEVCSEGLFDDHTPRFGAAGLGELFDNGREKHGRDSQVVGRELGAAEFALESGVRTGFAIVAIDIAKKTA